MRSSERSRDAVGLLQLTPGPMLPESGRHVAWSGGTKKRRKGSDDLCGVKLGLYCTVSVRSFPVPPRSSLEGVAAHGQDRAVSQVAEGAGDRRRGSVADDGEGEARRQMPLCLSAERKGRAAVDRDSVGDHLVSLLCVLRLEGVGVGRVCLEGERALDRESGLLICSAAAGARKAPFPSPVPMATAPAMIPFPPSVPAFTCTALVPLPEPLVLLITKVPSLTVVPAV